MKTPCNGCTKRHVGCHSVCKEYTEWAAEREEEREAAFRRSNIDQYNVDRILRGVKQRQRLRRKNGKEW